MTISVTNINTDIEGVIVDASKFEVNTTKIVIADSLNIDGLWMCTAKDVVNSTLTFKRDISADFEDPDYEIVNGTTFIVQLGKYAGAFVVTTVNTDNKTMTVTQFSTTKNVDIETKINEVVGAVNSILDLMAVYDETNTVTDVYTQLDPLS